LQHGNTIQYTRPFFIHISMFPITLSLYQTCKAKKTLA